MSDNTKVIYGILQEIFKNVWEQQKYSEVKNGVLLTFNIAIFTIISRVYFNISELLSENIVCKSVFYILLIFFIIHIVLIIQSYFPKDKNIENMKCNDEKINIFFFGDIQKLNSDKYLEIVVEKYKIKKDINKKPLLDLTNQIVKLSEITQYKYGSFKKSIYRMYVLTILFLLYFTYLFFN